jgi:serine/threonine-protein kinase
MFSPEPTPEKVGQYAIVRRLGGSGTVDVYLALGENTDGTPRLCELKLVHRVAGDAKQLAVELTREASVLGHVRHHAIVPLIELFEDDERVALVLEHIEGASLEQLLERRAARGERLPDGAILFAAHEVASALAHAHEAADEDGQLTPVVHRNVQPAHVLVSIDGQAHLTGFALGKILGRTPDTAAGVVKGTPGYMASEQTRGERATPRTDVYGLGLLLWTTLTGHKPPTGGPSEGSLREARGDLPRGLVDAIETALAASPARRRITSTEIELELAAAVDLAAGREALRREVRAFRAPPLAAAPRVDVTPLAAPPAPTPPVEVALRPIAPPTTTAPAVVPSAIVMPAAPAPLAAPPIPIEAVGPTLPLSPSLGVPPSLSLADDALDEPEPAPLSTLASLGIAATTALFIVGAGVAIAESDLAVTTTPRPAVAASASVSPATTTSAAATTSAATPTVAPATSAALATSGVPATSAAPATSVTPATSASRPPTPAPAPTVASASAPLDATHGRLTLTTDRPVASGSALVYVAGKPIGPVSQPLVVACGAHFVRVGAPADARGQIAWLAPGRSLAVPCRGEVTMMVTLDASGRDVLAH